MPGRGGRRVHRYELLHASAQTLCEPSQQCTRNGATVPHPFSIFPKIRDGDV